MLYNAIEICQRQNLISFLRHLFGSHDFENMVMTEKMGRWRLTYPDSLCESWKNNVSPTQLIRASADRHSIVVYLVP